MVSHQNIVVETTDSDQLSGLRELSNPEGDLFLRFYIESGQEFALPAQGIREVLALAPDQITPIPNVSPVLMGVLNLRGQVVWVTDIGQFLGHTKPLDTDCQEISIIAIESNEIIVGLAVDKVMDMDWLDAEKLSPSLSASDNMAPFLRGEWALSTNQFLRLLDPEAILRSARWAS
ncbi:chemotaxis protein CheW [Acaryochloris sp. IP29b_bin.137]|uniref:chemotaxis protein CheW n=1 Tax=Acaryochloris sp. IP29b_bin.137 TaxID=2969217 RepID=UPI00260A50B4|nr:chemotaxis protein CheW [Acaryochloris sp. IP29b_bin.137]